MRLRLITCLLCPCFFFMWPVSSVAQDDELDALFSDAPEQSEDAAEPEQKRAAQDESAPMTLPGEQNEEVIVLEEESPEPVRPPPQARVIEEIIVTANKREESLRELAASVSALAGDDMETQGLQDVDDIVNAVPGVNIVDPNSGEAKRITIRGISAGGVGTPATSGVFIGETPFTDAGQPRVNLDANPFDLASVEVLKGPVGTLFGGSGLNGAIRYLPKQPVMDEWEGKAFFERRDFRYGDAANVYGAALNIPLWSDKLSARVVGFDRKTAGYLDSTHPSYSENDVNFTEQDGVRGILAWDVSDGIALSAMYIDQHTLVNDGSVTDNSEGRFERGDTPSPSPRQSEYQLFSLTGSWAFEPAELVVNVARIDKGYDLFLDASNRSGQSFLPNTVLGQSTSGGGTADSQELRLVSVENGGNWDWLIGGFNFEHQVNEIATLQVETPLALGSATDLLPFPIIDGDGNVFALFDNIDALVKEEAFFGEINWRFRPGFQATLGLRQYTFTYDTVIVSDGAGSVLRDPAQPGSATINPKAKESGWNPKFSLSWELNDELMAYLTAARGFRFGGVNVNTHPETPPTYDSDSLWNYEFGVRSSWFDRSLIADASIYYVDWTDAQVGRFTSDGVFGFNDNVGQVEAEGFEAQLMWLPPIEQLSFNATVAYADVRTAEEFEGVPEGTRWPLAPKWQTSASVAWNQAVWDVLLGASLTHQYHGKARGLLENDFEVFGYRTWQFQLTLESATQPSWPRLSLNVNNITDERGVTFIDIFAGNVESYIAPFNASLRISLDF